MLQPLDGPAKPGKLSSVTDSTPIEVKAGASPQEERKVITLQSTKEDSPNYGSFYVYFADAGETPSAGDVSTNGLVHSKNAKETYEASETQTVWVMSVTGTIDIRLAERS